MTDMPITPAHAKPVSRRDHLWVLAIVAAFALYDVWGAWTNLGNKSGFPHGTGWTLTVIVEAYWGYALFAWLAAAPGRRSRRFAMLSAFGVFALSLIGQGASHLAAHSQPPPAVVVFVATLPVTVLALLAVLVHLRHVDRAEAEQVAEAAVQAAEQAAMERAEADERVALRAQVAAMEEQMSDEVDALYAEVSAAETARDDAQREAAEARTRADGLAKKLAAKSAQKTRTGQGVTAQSKALTTELRALKLLEDEPRLRQPRMGGEFARKLAVSPATGRRLHARLTAQQEAPEPLSGQTVDQPDERS